MTDAPLIMSGLERNDMQAEAQFRGAPWDAKRLILKLQLTRQLVENQRRGIDTSLIVFDETDKKSIYSYNTSYVHWAASLSKLFVTSLLLDDMRTGKVNGATVITWEAGDRRAGAGLYDAEGAPLSASINDVLFDMLNRSGNTAVRALVNKVLGGANAVNARYEKEYPELKVTRLQPVSATGFLLGYTTPAEVDFILRRLYGGADTHADFVKNALATNIFNDYGPRSQVKDTENLTVTDKQGQLNDPEGNNRHDVGVIENARNARKLRYVLMTTNYEQPAGEVTNYATASLQYFGKDMLRFEGDRTPHPSDTTLKSQAVPSAIENGRLIY